MLLKNHFRALGKKKISVTFSQAHHFDGEFIKKHSSGIVRSIR